MLTIVPPSSPEAVRGSRAHHLQRPTNVQAQHRVPALGGDALGGHEVLAAGVVEQRVEAAVALDRRPDDPLGVGGVADVARDVGAALADRVRRFAQDVLAPAGDHDVCTARRELDGGLPPEVGPAAGDKSGVPVE